MARIAGRNALVYVALTSGGTAQLLAYQAEYEINFSTPKIDVTAFTDTGKVTVAGLPQQDGTFRGFYDDATVQTYTAATDGVARAFYLYPSSSKLTQYFFGTINVDFTTGSTVAGATTMSAAWEAASTIAKVG